MEKEKVCLHIWKRKKEKKKLFIVISFPYLSTSYVRFIYKQLLYFRRVIGFLFFLFVFFFVFRDWDRFFSHPVSTQFFKNYFHLKKYMQKKIIIIIMIIDNVLEFREVCFLLSLYLPC